MYCLKTAKKCPKKASRSSAWGFDTYSKLKPVLRQSRLNGMALFLLSYSALARRLLGWMKR